MNINIQVLCNQCRECQYLKVRQHDMYADEKIYDRVYFCEHYERCLETIRVWEKQNESHIDN